MTPKPHDSGHTHAHAGPHGPDLARLLDLDAIVQRPALEQALATVADLVGTDTPRRILDIGAGTGTGSVALARLFPTAEVVAVDIDERMLERVRARARSERVADRVSTVAADASADEWSLGTADLIWSAVALHEVSDAPKALDNLFSSLRSGGLIVIVEMDAPPLVIPDTAAESEPEQEQHLRPAEPRRSPAFDHPDWSAGLAAAGFESLITRTLVTDHRMPADGPAGEYAALERRRTGQPELVGADQLHIRGTRTLWAARRP
ncbi:class I SAM-dependent methyltransferase [Subtercola boreus]|nr:methyltransferase domain-containing protein [Subtercola boreus]